MKCKPNNGKAAITMGTVGNDNERLKILLYNAVEIIYETWYLDVDYATFADGIKDDIGITKAELDEIGFTNWEVCDEVVVEDEPAPKFWEDFTQAEAFGTTSIRTRFGLAFDKYKDNPEVMADLVSTAKVKASMQKVSNHAFSELYDELWKKAEDYATMNYDSKDLNEFLKCLGGYGLC